MKSQTQGVAVFRGTTLPTCLQLTQPTSARTKRRIERKAQRKAGAV